jgi:hypothetical protein
VPIKLVLRGRVRGQEEEITAGDDERPVTRPVTRPMKPSAKSGQVGAKPTRRVKRPSESKPHRKKSARGPARGTRPK